MPCNLRLITVTFDCISGGDDDGNMQCRTSPAGIQQLINGLFVFFLLSFESFLTPPEVTAMLKHLRCAKFSLPLELAWVGI